MTVTIHQPEFLPYLGFFDRIKKADTFIILDNVQYQKNAFINRNKIKTPQGWQWLTVPVKKREKLDDINKVQIDNSTNWRGKHLKAIILNYKKAPCFEKYIGFFEEAYKKEWNLIADLNVYFIEGILELLGIDRNIRTASSLGEKGNTDELLVDILNKLGADTYLSGSGNDNYDPKNMAESFKKNGIEMIFHQFNHLKYRQLWGEFIPNLSIIDFLFNSCYKKI